MEQHASTYIPPHHQLPAGATVSTNRRRWLGALILVTLLLLAILAVHHHRKQKAARKSNTPVSEAVAVTPAVARAGDMDVYLDAIGTVTPVYTDSITAQVTGVIKSVHYSEGQLVRRGDPLIEIDPAPYAAQLAEAHGSLSRDQNLLAQAQMDLERYRGAWGRNGIPRQQLEDQEKVVLADQGTVNYDLGMVQYAEVQLKYCHITAPIDGRIGLRLVDPGNLVVANATTTLLVITTIQPITVVFTLAEDSLSEVLDQMSHRHALTVQAYDRGREKLLGTGKLITIDNQIDTTTGTVKLRAEFDNSGNTLFPNQFVNTKLLVTTLHDQVLIPSSAIQHNGDKALVYVLHNGKAIMRTVTSGVSDRDDTAVQGIQPGEVIANSSFEKLQNGSRVVLSHFTLPPSSSELDEGGAP